MSKSKIKSICILVLSLIICFGVLAGCGQKLSSDFDEAEVKSAAENVITLVNEKDSEGLREMSTVQMKEGLTDDLLNKVYEAIGEGGAFKNVENMGVAGMTNKENNEELAVVVAKAKYENKSFTYTIRTSISMIREAVVAMAAPSTPSCGAPKWPKIST
jgi:pimeloyl-CoA synthetase